LFNRHILQDRENLEQIREALGRLVAELQQQVRDTGGGIPRYVETLSRFAAVLSSGIEVQAADVDRVLFETRSTYDNQTRLQQELAGVYGEMESLRRELNHLREEAMMDALTGIGNRRAFDVAVAAVLQDRPTNGCLFSVLLVDIDDFKRFNDTYGHLIGDRVLRFVARVLKSSIKGRDTAARYGGEEFAVLLPGTAIENARSVAEQIRKEVAAGVLKDTNSGREFGRITISVGVGTYRNGETMDAVMDRADKALYRAKQAGRDRVVTAN